MADYFAAGLKGRWNEERRTDDHQLTNDSTLVDVITEDGEIGRAEVAALVGLNTDLRAHYISNCRKLASTGGTSRSKVPGCHSGYGCRTFPSMEGGGVFKGIEATPDGVRISADEWTERKSAWLPTDVDKTYVRSLMRPVHERGKIAAWIAPPRNGINGKPFDYEYVHLT